MIATPGNTTHRKTAFILKTSLWIEVFLSFHLKHKRATFGVKTNSNTLFVYERTRRTHGTAGH